MFWYVVLEGNTLPTPYKSMEEAFDAINELRARLGACICDVVLK